MQRYACLATEKNNNNFLFINSAIGVSTGRDSWVIGFSREKTLRNVKKFVENYNLEVDRISKICNPSNENLDRNPEKLKWTSELEKSCLAGEKLTLQGKVIPFFYRPFTKKWLVYDKKLVHRPGKYFAKWGNRNKVIVTTGRSASRPFSVLASECIPDYHAEDTGQGFMRYDNSDSSDSLFQADHNNMNQAFADKLGLSLDDTFVYIYGLLNSPEYQQKYANDLKKDLARIPIVANKEKYVEVGKKLMVLHLNYEKVPACPDVKITASDDPSYVVKKMKFGKKLDPEINRKVNDRSKIIFNSDITVENIPEKAYEYIVNGRSAIEWIMDQYQIKTDKKSGITDDPNDFSDYPKYIFNLLLRIINVSVQTVDLVNSLPKLEIIE